MLEFYSYYYFTAVNPTNKTLYAYKCFKLWDILVAYIKRFFM